MTAILGNLNSIRNLVLFLLAILKTSLKTFTLLQIRSQIFQMIVLRQHLFDYVISRKSQIVREKVYCLCSLSF